MILRNQEYHRLPSSSQKVISEANNIDSPSPIPSYTFLLETVDDTEEILKLQEEQTLKANTKLLKNLVNCFGVLLAHTHDEIGNADGEQHIRNNIFSETFTWLSKLTSEVAVRRVFENGTKIKNRTRFSQRSFPDILYRYITTL